MAFLKKENNAQSLLSSSISNVDTSLIVVDASSFPTTGDFLVTIWDKDSYSDPSSDSNMEVIKVTSILGNVFTIERGQEGTSGVSHSENEAVEMLITQGHFKEIEDAIDSHIENISNPHQVSAEQINTSESGLTIQDKLDYFSEQIEGIYTKRITFDGTYYYKGEAVPSSLESDNVWRIQRIDEDGTRLFSNGNSLFVNKWDDVLTLSYS